MAETRGLGKGMRALIPEGSIPQGQTTPSKQLQESKEISPSMDSSVRVPLQAIQASRYQPRKSPKESGIQELAESIRTSGLIYPLLVRKIGQSGVDGPIFELIAGERRFRALKLLGEKEAPVLVRDVPDKKAFELGLIENLQREDLTPIEEAHALDRLGKEFELTQEEVAKVVGKDRATVANTLRLLKLAPQVQEGLALGRLSLGAARAILAVESHAAQIELARRVIHQGLSVRQVERIAREMSENRRRVRSSKARDPHLVAAEQKLQRSLGTNVQIFHGKTRGWIRIAYYSLKDMDRLLKRLTP